MSRVATACRRRRSRAASFAAELRGWRDIIRQGIESRFLPPDVGELTARSAGWGHFNTGR